MHVALTDTEWAFLSRIPEADLVQMAIDFDILLPAVLDERSVIQECLARFLEVAPTEGIPLSKYDRDDLADLPPAHLAALARLIGLPASATVDAVLKAGIRAHKTWLATGRGRGVPLLVPTLLPTLARLATLR